MRIEGILIVSCLLAACTQHADGACIPIPKMHTFDSPGCLWIEGEEAQTVFDRAEKLFAAESTVVHSYAFERVRRCSKEWVLIAQACMDGSPVPQMFVIHVPLDGGEATMQWPE